MSIKVAAQPTSGPAVQGAMVAGAAQTSSTPEATLAAVRAAVEAASSEAYSAVITPEYKQELTLRAHAVGLTYDAYVAVLLAQLRAYGPSIWALRRTVDLPERKVFSHILNPAIRITVVLRGESWLMTSPWSPIFKR